MIAQRELIMMNSTVELKLIASYARWGDSVLKVQRIRVLLAKWVTIAH